MFHFCDMISKNVSGFCSGSCFYKIRLHKTLLLILISGLDSIEFKEITEMMCLMTSQGPVHSSANIGLAWTCSDLKSVAFHIWPFIELLWKQKLHKGGWKWKVHYLREKGSEKMPMVHFTVLYRSRFANTELKVMVNALRVSTLCRHEC